MGSIGPVVFPGVSIAGVCMHLSVGEEVLQLQPQPKADGRSRSHPPTHQASECLAGMSWKLRGVRTRVSTQERGECFTLVFPSWLEACGPTMPSCSCHAACSNLTLACQAAICGITNRSRSKCREQHSVSTRFRPLSEPRMRLNCCLPAAFAIAVYYRPSMLCGPTPKQVDRSQKY